METPAESSELIVKARRHTTPALMVIGIFKLFKSVLLLCAGLAVLHFLNHDVGAFVMALAMKLHFEPANQHLHALIAWLLSMSVKRDRMELISAATFLYSLLYGIEGVGLLLDRTWAEWMTVITTAGFVPWEVYEIYDSQTLLRIGLLALNLVILTYLVYRVSIKVRAHAERKRLLAGFPVQDAREAKEKPAPPSAG